MKQPERTIDLVERQIAIAKRDNKPRVLAKLEAELAEMKANRPVKVVPELPRRMKNTYDNLAAMAFYSDKRFKLD